MSRTLVVVGIGDVFEKFYLPAIEELKSGGEEIEVFCVDDKSKWLDENVKKKRANTLTKLENLKLTFVDKSDNISGGSRKYQDLLHNYVELAVIATPDKTHIDVANEWLGGNCLVISIEKPIADKSADVDSLIDRLSLVDPERVDVWAFDHYRAKAHEVLGETGRRTDLLELLEAPLKKVRFYALEDYSGTHDEYLAKERARGSEIFPERNGPIEIVAREGTLQEGLLLDMMTHMPALLNYFGDVNSVEVQEIKAAKYRGVGYDDAIFAKIEGETFAAVKFTFSDDDEQNDGLIEGEAYVGKGILGSEEHKLLGNVKLLELEGSTGVKLQLNFTENRIVLLKGGEVNPVAEGFQKQDPYLYLLRYMLFPVEGIEPLGMLPVGARDILRKVEEMRDLIAGCELPGYLLGQRENGDPHGRVIRRPPSLEELLSSLPALYERK
jgi:predicted dehydrogenase